ncbi:hypothetical protein SLE2022_038630 [Rubroshorea leprosula]
MAPSKTAAKQNSGTSITNKNQRTAWRRKQLSLKKLKAEMEDIKVEMEKLRAEVYIISQGQKHLKGKRSKGKEKAGMEELVHSTLHRATGEQGTKRAHAKKRQGLNVKFNKQLKRKKTILLRMEAEAAEARAETSHMREGAAEMVEAMEEKEADLELLRMLHDQLFVDVLHISEAEERLMEILLS